MPSSEVARRLAALTPGFAGADIANICNEAAIVAARWVPPPRCYFLTLLRSADKEHVDLSDFEKAIDRVIGGLEKRNASMSAHERRIVAYHEAGHAVVGWFLENADPLLKVCRPRVSVPCLCCRLCRSSLGEHKRSSLLLISAQVTIVPRDSGALGFAQYLPKEVALYNQNQLEDRMCMSLGGRAAEQVFFGRVSTGAVDDLNKVTKQVGPSPLSCSGPSIAFLFQAYSQIGVYGMSKTLGNVSFQRDEGDYGSQRAYSEKTAEVRFSVHTTLCSIMTRLRRSIRRSKNSSLRRTSERCNSLRKRRISSKHLPKSCWRCEQFSAVLTEQHVPQVETVSHEVIIEILGERPFQTDAYREFLTNSRKGMSLRW